MDKCTARVRVRDACGDGVRATIIKEKEKENIYLLLYGDDLKQKFNLDLCTNPVGVPILGRVMLDSVRSQSLLCSLLHYKVEH